MALRRIEKDKEQVCIDPKPLLKTNEDLENEVVRGTVNKLDSINEFQRKVAQAIKANDLCYNCETGFHYME